MAAAGERAESQPLKQTRSLQKQDSSKYLRGEGVQVTSQENIEKRVANRTNREKTGVSSQSKPNSSNNVIYKVSSPIQSISGPFFLLRSNFGRVWPPTEALKGCEVSNTPGSFKFSGHQIGVLQGYNISSEELNSHPFSAN